MKMSVLYSSYQIDALLCFSQEWVRERCLQSPDDLLKSGTLLDRMLNLKQAQKLLRLICMPSYSTRDSVGGDKDAANSRGLGGATGGSGNKKAKNKEELEEREKMKSEISKMLNSIDEWNLRVFGGE